MFLCISEVHKCDISFCSEIDTCIFICADCNVYYCDLVYIVLSYMMQCYVGLTSTCIHVKTDLFSQRLTLDYEAIKLEIMIYAK